jgi:cytochrome oxidase assembly protein ShyY1
MIKTLHYIILVLLATTLLGFWQVYDLKRTMELERQELKAQPIRCIIKQRNVEHEWPCSVVGKNIAMLGGI